MSTRACCCYIPYEEISWVTRVKELGWGMPVVTPGRQRHLFALQIPSQKAGWGLPGKISSIMPFLRRRLVWAGPAT